MKLNINDKDGKSYKKELNASEVKLLVGKNINDELTGETIGLTGYVLKIMGGSDKQGFPMRKTLKGQLRKRLLTSPGVGFKSKIGGIRKKKSIRGNQIGTDILQLNLKVIKAGKTPLSETFKKEEKAEETA